MATDPLPTPALLLDMDRMDANIARMNAAIARHGVALRPHVKTVKSAPLAAAMTQCWSGAVTVSTLAEAEAMFAAGHRDILYAVGFVPAKSARAAALVAAGARLTLVVDSVAAAAALGPGLAALIEIDSDGQRAGIAPDRPDEIVAVGRALVDAGAELRGVMTHAGGSYAAADPAELPGWAERERAAAVGAAMALRAAGLPAPMVSVGSTPTALFAEQLDGVTEVRAGVYAFMDLVMAGLGVCAPDAIALSVLASVIGHQPGRGRLLIDAGWMALSRDRGTGAQAVDHGYGLICDEAGTILPELIVAGANQEHGVVARRDGGAIDWADFPIGAWLRILPNHACATAAQHGCYHLLRAGRPVGSLDRFGGW